jgi:hypothetical protein
MKTIAIPSESRDKCNTLLHFEKEESPSPIWNLEIEVTTPEFTGKRLCHIEDDNLRAFIEDLSLMEKNRRGECVLGYTFSGDTYVKIYSIDSLGHFAVEVHIEKIRYTNSNIHLDLLEVVYEIEPSSLITLSKDFVDLT